MSGTATQDHHRHHHDHEHEHEHHEHGTKALAESYAHVQGGPTVLDIGGDIGAVFARMPASAAGSELHLRSEDDPLADIHTGVWSRTGTGDDVTSAVFAELTAGSYWVLDGAGREVLKVVVVGGALSSIDLRAVAGRATSAEGRPSDLR